jgi:hypothetical protein
MQGIEECSQVPLMITPRIQMVVNSWSQLLAGTGLVVPHLPLMIIKKKGRELVGANRRR